MSTRLVKILKLKFRQDFEGVVVGGQYFAADVWLRLRISILVKNLKLGFKFKFSRDTEVWLRF